MSRTGPERPTPTRERDGRRVRWPLLMTAALLGVLLLMTTGIERSAPRLASSAPAVAGIPAPVRDEPVRCSRSDDAARIEELREELREDGRITSELVTACPRLFDAQHVIHFGEVVGDVLVRAGGAWVQINDDPYALEVGPLGAHRERRGFSAGLAVWLPDELHEGLGPPGRHGRRGPIVRIEGVLHRADPEDGGGLTIRATALDVIAPPVSVDAPLDTTLVAAAVASGLLAILVGAWARARSRGRTH